MASFCGSATAKKREAISKLLSIFWVRKANLPEQGDAVLPSPEIVVGGIEAKELHEAARNMLLQYLRTVGVNADIRETLAGPRINRYKLFLS